ncbi:hypothetical protein [Natrinema salinisoli]|uniref:hypothetical protein n=1 Tax=Natrinema salinisoli TaxID=2878535 RepID=UPI001CF0CD10|nr:hypothetical protein [Natrinema salinisoli]
MGRDRSASEVESSNPVCPRCGDPVTFVTAVGPQTGTASPCGCSVPPGLIECEND